MEYISAERNDPLNGNLRLGNRDVRKLSDPHEFSDIKSSKLASHLAACNGEYIPIPQFYAGRSVFITGGSGFVGKVLIEKLLRSCPDIKNIYLLIRTKRGKAVSTRLTELFNVPLFDTLRRENPKQLNKVIPISGDITMEELDISKSDQAMLCRNVSIVFHSAATVRFDEKLKLSVVINMLGTKRLIELCHRIVSLDALIHVSTAYSNCDRAEVSEIIYDAPYKPDDIISLINLLPDVMIDELTPSLIGKLPNTYAFTKALAEHVLVKEDGNLPIAIVRPSIVIATSSEPFPGWVDNFNGPTGLVAGIGHGIFRTIICQKDKLVDLIPVDFVINCMISAAWCAATNKSNQLSIYNCCSGQRHPVTWGEFMKLFRQQLRKNPFEGCLWYPDISLYSNRLMYTVHRFLVHSIPAYGVDIILRLMGKKPFLVRNQNKLYKVSTDVNFFTTNQWLFRDGNVHDLFATMSQRDQETFAFNVSTIDWSKYMETYILGIREYLLKQLPESLPASRRRLKCLFYLNQLMKWLTVMFTGSFVMMNWSPMNTLLMNVKNYIELFCY